MIGFSHSGKKYVWHKKKLYRLPFESNLRFYGLHECKPWKDGYIVGTQRKSLKQLRSMSVEDIDFVFPQETDDTPF